MRGLSTKLQSRLALNNTGNFTDLVNGAIVVEDAIRAHQDEKKKKRSSTGFSVGAASRYRLVYTRPRGKHYRPPQYQQQGARPPQQMTYRAPSPQLVAQGFRSPQQFGKTTTDGCYNCGRPGHFAKQCPNRKLQASAPRPPAPGVQQQQRGQPKAGTSRTVCIHYTTLEEVPEGEQVLADMFSVYNQLVLVLFDFGASHSFISRAYVQRYSLPTRSIKSPYVVKSPGGTLGASQIVWGYSS